MSQQEPGPARLPQREIPPPTGEVTLAFTDVQGSTRLWESDPAAMTDALRLHDLLIRDLIVRHHGYEVKTEGDAFMVAFSDPVAAVSWALGVQSALFGAAWDDDILALPPAREEDDVFRGLRVRIGLHLGEPECRPDPMTGRMDYFGTVVNRSARVGGCGHGGQVVISSALWERVQADLPDVGWQDLGGHLLKGLRTPTGLVEVLPRSLAGRSFPPVKSVAATGDRPFRGLQSFGTGDGKLFFGREEEIRSLTASVRQYSIVTVTGSSGAGKTSLLHAGLPPHIPELQPVCLRPGPDPLGALCGALETVVEDWARLAALTNLLRTDPGRFGAALVRVARERERGLLILVDQAEELMTLARDRESRDLFVRCLLAATEDSDAPVRLVLSVREDFFGRLALIEPLRGRYARRVEVLARPGPAQLVEALVKPAALFGFAFEDAELPREMVTPIAEEPAALAMLQVCADRMWDERDLTRRLLTRAAYAAVGGIEGALAAHADSVLDGLDGARRSEARRVLLRLVTSEGTRAPCDRAELLGAARQPEMSAEVVDLLVRDRLLTAREAEDGSATVEIVHEALVRHWGRLVGWLTEDREGLVLHNALRQAVADWLRRGQTEDALWRGELLRDLRRWQERSSPDLTIWEEEFAAASRRLADRRRRRERRTVAAVMVVLATTTAWAVLQWRDAVTERGIAEVARAAAADAAHESRIRALNAGSDAYRASAFPERALVLARAAFALAPDRARSSLYSSVGAQDELSYGMGHQGRINSVDWDPAGARLVTASADGTARIWSDTLEPLHTTPPHGAPVDGAVFVSEDRVGSWDHGGGVRMFDAAARPLAQDAIHTSWLNGGLPLPGGAGLVTWGSDGQIVLRDADGGVTAHRLLEGGAEVTDASVLPDGSLVIADTANQFALLDSALQTVWRKQDPNASFYELDLSSRGVIAAGTRHGAVHYFDESGVDLARIQLGVDEPIRALRWSPDGLQLLLQVSGLGNLILDDSGQMVKDLAANGTQGGGAWSEDQRYLFLWGGRSSVGVESLDGRVQMSMTGPRANVSAIDVQPGGQLLAVGALDGVLRLYPGRGGGARATYAHAQRLSRTARAPRTGTIVTTGTIGRLTFWSPELEQRAVVDDGVVRSVPRWAPSNELIAVPDEAGRVQVFTPEGELVASMTGHEGAVRAVDWAPDGARLVTAGADGTAVIWDAATWAQVGQTIQHSAVIWTARFSPDGQAIATGSNDTAAALWSADGVLLGGLNDHTEGVAEVAWHPDGTLLATTGGDGRVLLWDVASGTLARALDGHTDSVWWLAWSPDGTRLASGGADGTIRLWPRDGRDAVVVNAHEGTLGDISWSPDGEILASTGSDRSLRLWRPDGRPHAEIRSADEELIGVSWSGDSKRITIGAGQALRVFEATDAGNLARAKEMVPVQPDVAELDRLLDLR